MVLLLPGDIDVVLARHALGAVLPHEGEDGARDTRGDGVAGVAVALAPPARQPWRRRRPSNAGR
eukprot:13077663-Heterocapsa_arctica.AAC.1